MTDRRTKRSPATFDQDIAENILRTVNSLDSRIDARIARLGSPQQTREKQVRIAQTVSSEFPYPSGESNKYEIALGKPDFDDTSVGLAAPSFEAYTGDNVRIASSLTPLEIAEGSLVFVRLCHGKWYIESDLGSGGSGSSIIFQIICEGSVQEAYSSLCEDQLADAGSRYKAKVLWRPCGVPTVPEEDVDGNVEVFDELGAFLSGREEAEVCGKIGIAQYLEPDMSVDYEGCRWVITFIDWWREVQMITDVIVTDARIRFKVKNVMVWDDCDLDPIDIPLIDCEDEYA